jgi:hypothetical protein
LLAILSANRADSEHSHTIASVVVLDSAHEVLHQEQSSPARPFAICVGTWVGNGRRVKAGPLVLDFDPHVIPDKAVGDSHVLLRILTVAVPNRIGDCLVETIAECERLTPGHSQHFCTGDEFIDHRAAFTDAAGNPDLPVRIICSVVVLHCARNHEFRSWPLVAELLRRYTHIIGQILAVTGPNCRNTAALNQSAGKPSDQLSDLNTPVAEPVGRADRPHADDCNQLAASADQSIEANPLEQE